MGRQASRTAGEMDLRAHRGVRHRLYGPRSHRVGRTGARRRRPHSGAAHIEPQQYRRAHRLLRAAGQGRRTGDGRLPHSHRVRARAVLSNTMCTTPYRSAGRPEVIYVIERLIDKAAQEHGFDRVALRRRNLIPPSAFPYKNPQGITYDNGTYRVVMDRAMELGDWKGFKKRRADARKRKRLRGIGLCCYLETTGGYPRERADITVHSSGRVDVVVGTLSSGQSHETTFAQCVSEWLGVPFDDVYVDESDTDIVKEGGGSHSARSMRLAGIVMGNASDLIIEKGKKIAAH